MADTRKKNVDWVIAGVDGTITWSGATVAVLMDIRDELKTLNQLLACPNFIAIPRKLDSIISNTTKVVKQTKRRTK